MTPLSEFFNRQVELYGAKPAIQHRPRFRTVRWRYEELGAAVRRLEEVLVEHRVEPGDRVLLYSENSPHWAAALFAVLSRGAVAVPLNPKSTPAQINQIVVSCQPGLALVSSSSPFPAPLKAVAIDPDGAANDVPAVRRSGTAAGESGPAEIIYTSGTTGEPKGVVLSHRNLLSDLESLAKAVPLTSDDHVLTLVPLFHVFGQMTGLLCPLYGGCSVTYLAAPTTRAIREALAYTPATHLVAVPEVLKTMMDRLESRLGRMPGFLRRALRGRIRSRVSKTLGTIVCGGAPLDAKLEEKWRDLGFEILQGYGLTETSPVISTNTPAAHRPGSVGKPLDCAEVKLAPDGEILVRGPIVMQGYYRDPRRTEAAFSGGWFKTGDTGRFDEDGYLYVFGRKKYMILGPGGENVFPEDVEAELNRIPGVIDSAVVGLPRGGRTVIHAALLCAPERIADIVAQANRNLAPHQRIMSWSVWPEPDFPRSATRKIKKEDVIRHLGGQPPPPPAAAGRLTPVKRLLAEVTGFDVRAIADSSRIVSELNVDSLLRVELVSRIEDELGIYVEEVQITPQLTVGDLEILAETQKGRAPSLGKYPRWSLSPWAGKLRPLARQVFFNGWMSRFCRLRVEGAEHLAELRGPAVFMANHRSFLDPIMAIWAIPEPFRSRLGIAAATDVLYRRFRWFAPLAELAFNAFPFPVGAKENIRPGLDYIGRMLDDGWSVLIFPEGGLNRSDKPMQRLKGGTGVVAAEMQVAVVPVAIRGTEKIMPPDTGLPKAKGEVLIRFGQPIKTGKKEGYGAATARIEAGLRALLESPA